MNQSVFNQISKRVAAAIAAHEIKHADNTTFGDGSSVSSPLSTKDLCIFEDGTNSETTFPLDSIENADDASVCGTRNAFECKSDRKQFIN